MPSLARACCSADGGGVEARDLPAVQGAPGTESAAEAAAEQEVSMLLTPEKRRRPNRSSDVVGIGDPCCEIGFDELWYFQFDGAQHGAERRAPRQKRR